MRFFTSDQHFGHTNIITYCNRPFANAETMVDGLIDRHNSVVGPDDDVWMLGDFSLSPRYVDEVLPLLNGRKYLVAGNHDKCWTGNKKGVDQAIVRYSEAGFDQIFPSGIVVDFELTNGRYVTLSHMPYTGESNNHTEDRYKSFRPIYKGQPNLCGHVHDAWKTQGKSVNVGVDMWNWYPVSEDQVIEQIEIVSANL